MPNGSRANSFQNQEYQAAQAFRDGLVRERAAAAAREVEMFRGQQIPEGRKGELAKDLAEKRAIFLKSVAVIKPIIDQAEGDYRRLKGDSAVRDALNALGRSTKATVFLGPSREFRRAVDTLREADRAYSLETAVPKKKGRPSRR
jgi:hypothetical protein